MLGRITFIILLIYVFVKRAEFFALYARLQFQKGNTDKAVRWFAVANRLGPLKAESMMYYGYILLRTGNIRLAEEVLTRASLKAKKPAVKKRIKSLLSLVVWKNGDIDSAIEMMEDAISDFKVTSFYQNLGLLYNLKGDNKKALDFNLEAYDYNPDDLIISDNLAEAYVLCGETDKAMKQYETLLEKEPHFPEPYYNFGLLLIENGEKEKGIDYIKQSLDKRFTFLSVKTKEEVEAILKEKTE
ncbi:MAG: tetratricopeptide repeat protein [Clostridia bacterium]|nr:tetratricopeptide repeat protein [Clostridia bacterium]